MKEFKLDYQILSTLNFASKLIYLCILILTQKSHYFQSYKFTIQGESIHVKQGNIKQNYQNYQDLAQKNQSMELGIQSFQQNELTPFPILLQKQFQVHQISQKQKQSQLHKHSIWIKFPSIQAQQLKHYLKIRPNSKYPTLFVQQAHSFSAEQFLTKMYQPLDQKFIQDMKKEFSNAKQFKIHFLGNFKVYIGIVKDEKCQGKGILIFKNGIIYEGQFKENKRHGKGSYLDPNVGIYQGQYVNDFQETKSGLEVFFGKTVYKGQFLNGLAHGKGLYVDNQNNQYFGQWRLGIMHGQKSFLKNSSSTYYGQIVNWLKHGQGEQIFQNGDYYKGEYQNGKFDGFGCYKWSNQALYEGTFKNGYRHGKGKWSAQQTKYLGNYAQGLKQGYGELYFSSGNFYKGNFINDKKDGYGQMFWTDGSFYKGEWKNGTQNGKGQIYISGGEIVNGIFQNSILVQVIPTIYEKEKMEMEANNYDNSEFTSTQPTGILNSRERALSQNKRLSYNKKRLTRIQENIKKPVHNSVIKSKIYFKSPQKSDRSYSKQVGRHGKECKCIKRLENFRLKQKKPVKLNNSKMQQTYS